MSTGTKTLPPKPPPRMPATKPPDSVPSSNGTFQLNRVGTSDAHRVLIFGTGGIGKTSVACTLARVRGPVAFFDFDGTLELLRPALTEAGVADSVRKVNAVHTWDDLRAALHAPLWSDVKSIVIDTVTRVEELAVEWTLKNTKHEKGHYVNRIEDYGFGKGLQHVYETFLCLFGDLDQHIRAGRNVVLVAHEITATVPNPTGDDFLRFEPRLQHPASGKSSVRSKAKEWADHLLYIGYDLVVDSDGVAQGSGSRTIYVREKPFCMAKSRTLRDNIVFEESSSELWETMFAEPVKGA